MAFHPWLQTMAAWIPDTLRGQTAVSACFRQLDLASRCITRLAGGNESACQIMLSVEGAGAMELPEIVTPLAAAGVRLASLTWNADNAWASGCCGCGGGLTAKGKTAVTLLEREKITVDVSHLNEVGFWQLTAITKRPFIASHSNAAAVFPHPRNLSDRQFCAIRDRGGLVGLNLYPGHLGGAIGEQFVRHLEHFLALDGEKTLCIGTDLDGFDLPANIRGVETLETIWTHLIRLGYPIPLLDDIFYNNAYRFFFGR